MRFLRTFLAAGLLAGLALPAPAEVAAEAAPAQTAQIAPAKTSIYLGSVALTVQPLNRRVGEYASTYTATVFPFFFCNEQGKFRIQVSDTDLLRLADGHAIDFDGQAVRNDGVIRLVHGHAVPHGPDRGDVKIRVVLSRRFVLIFNTTYQLMGGIK